ncbi:MAG: hypothetical protein AW12_00087 [Candidatus Accumulibacter sp. BA-94]|nr:MAG: hypothetical protein AW12_00087 [Candidatus Accumulibacter sp. BA-94]
MKQSRACSPGISVAITWHQRGDHTGVGSITADQAVLPQGPDIAEARHGIGRNLGNVVGGIRFLLLAVVAGIGVLGQQCLDLGGVESCQRQIEVGQLEVFEFQREHGVVPFRPGCRPIGQKPKCPDLGIGQFVGQDHGHCRQAQSARRLEPCAPP